MLANFYSSFFLFQTGTFDSLAIKPASAIANEFQAYVLTMIKKN
jgi:hypothetical protein